MLGAGLEFKNGKRQRYWQGFAKILIWIVGILWLLPIIWMISTSLKPETMIVTRTPQWIPRVVTLENYRTAIQKAAIFRWLMNSTLVAVITTILVLLIDAMAAYAFARLEFFGRDVIFAVVLATLMVPGQVTIIPLYLFFNDLDLIDTYPAVILPRMAAAIGVFMLRQFFLSIPVDLEEAARIDGCSRYGIFWRIILPLARPSLTALAIFTLVWSWNDFMWPLIVLPSKEMYTLPVGISTLVGYHGRDWGMQMASSFLASLPVLILFLIFQREFIKGVAMTGLKG